MENILSPEISQSVAVSTVTSLALQPPVLANLALAQLISNLNAANQNLLAFQQQMYVLGLSVVASSVSDLLDLKESAAPNTSPNAEGIDSGAPGKTNSMTAASQGIEDALKSVSLGTLRAIAEQPAMLANLAYANLITNTNLAQQNAVANQQALNEIALSVTAASVNAVSAPHPVSR
jgi:hypothetical protein